jgi:hypothetical protein
MPSTVADGSSHADGRPTVTIDLSAERDRWRYRCPNNHTSWSPINGFVHCKACADQHGVDPVYDHLLDAKSGREVARADIEFH